MSLRLTITSAQRQALGAASVRVVSGGSTTIGRAPGNDWILADPQGVVSRQHARIDRQGAEYVLTDTSVNGTYVNDSPEPIGNGRSHRLALGDQIFIGDYVIVASIEPISSPGDPPPIFPGAEPTADHEEPIDRILDEADPTSELEAAAIIGIDSSSTDDTWWPETGGGLSKPAGPVSVSSYWRG